MLRSHTALRCIVLAACMGALSGVALADDAAIRKSIAERMPDLPKIDEISKTPIPGVYEIRFGADIYYTAEQGQYLLDGHIIDTKTRQSLTEQRVNKLTAFDFAAL